MKAPITATASHARIVALTAILACAGPALSQAPPATSVVEALQQGGHVLVMRHARSPRTAPDAAGAAAGNTARERQLDAAGRETAVAMGEALRDLGIPVGAVLSSPTFRALETARYLGLGDAEPVAELGDGGIGMQPDSAGRRSEWLRAAATELLPTSQNILMITHLPNLVGAFGGAAAEMADGEALILRPDGERTRIAGRIRIEDWPALAGD